MEINRDLLHKYFKGETIPDEEKLIMDWAELSPKNYRLYLEERKKWNALLIHSYKIKIESSGPVKAKVFNLWKIAGIAASIALLIALSWIGYDIQGQQESRLQSVIVPTGQRVQLILEDGTKVWLNSKTSFSYPTSFGSQTREVQLDGEGFFEVTRNENKPFIVKTKKYDIKVLGTTFNVYAYENEISTFETSLLSGSVDISSKTNAGQHVLLKTNEKVSEAGGLLKKSIIENPERFRWKEGLICLDDVPFDQLINKFSIYYDVQIEIENPNVHDYRCTGKFHQSDGVEYALRVIQKDLKFHYTRNSETNTITIK